MSCQAITRTGKPCGNPMNARTGSSEYCGLHDLARLRTANRIDRGLPLLDHIWRVRRVPLPSEDVPA